MPKALRVLVVGPKHSSANSRGGMAELVDLMRTWSDPRVRIRTVATYVDDARATRLRTGVIGTAYAVALIVARRVDVVHVHLAHRGSVVRKAFPLRAARLVRTPAVIHAHSYDFAGWYDGLRSPAQAAVRWLLPAERWFVLGDGLAADYNTRLRLAPGVAQVLRNPVRLPAALPDRPAGGPVRVVSLGRLGRRKGSYDLVAALALLAPDIRVRLDVTIAGDGEVDEVRAAAAGAGVDDVLTVRSWVGAAERDALLARADVFVLASYEEGLPLALLEAMAFGLAPVTTPVGGIPDVVTDGVDALLVAPGDTAALAHALETLVSDAPQRAAIGAAARQRATVFAADGWFERLVSEWTRLAAARR